MHAFFADFILIAHFALVLFIFLGLGVTWLGAWQGWRWVRNLWFRVAHLCAIVFVAAEASAGIWCPLTIWEAELRGARAEKGFIAHWIHRLLFYDFPPWVFTTAYIAFALLVAVTFWLMPPQRKSSDAR